jgi:sugar phosphate isomerase/epimerase
MNDPQLSVLVVVGFEELPLAHQLPMVQWLGAGEVQLWPNYERLPDPAEVRRQVADAGLTVRAIHGPYSAADDLSSAATAVRAAAVDHLAAALDYLAACRAAVRPPGNSPHGVTTSPFMVVHPAAHGTGGMRRKEERLALRRVADALAVTVAAAEERGLRLALENMPPDILGHRIEDLLGIVETVASPTVGLCFDTGHANMAGRAPKMFRAAAPRTIACHVHDNNGKDDEHRVPFEGALNWKDLRAELARADYAGDFTLECLEALMLLYRRRDTAWRDRFRQWWTGGVGL